MSFLSDFINLLYPQLCLACNIDLVKGEEFICLSCRVKLPRTNYHLQHTNPVEQSFWGLAKIEKALSYLYFRKGESVQKLMHAIKYRGEKEFATYIGRLYGDELRQSNTFQSIDGIVPIPLHKTKLAKRGFNQSEWFAKGLSEKLNAPVIINNLQKTTATESQTRKNRWQRWVNMGEVFTVKHPAELENKHLLLVDDTITTGATLMEATEKLLAVNGCRVSIATMAFARD